MKDSKQSSWNCIGSMFSNSDQILLLKKKQNKDNKSASYRNNKSEEHKPQIQNKTTKKSLKKRSSSNIASDIQIFQQQLNDGVKNQQQQSLTFAQNQLIRQQCSFYPQQMYMINNNCYVNTQEHRNISYYEVIPKQNQNYGEKYREKPKIAHSQQDIFAQVPENFGLYNQQKYNSNHRKVIGQSKYQNQQISFLNNNLSQKQIEKSSNTYYEDKSFKLTTQPQINKDSYNKDRDHISIFYQKQSIILQDTETLLKNRQEYKSQQIFIKNQFLENKQFQSPEKPFGLKKLIMKLASSDDQKDSQSPPSEVIGKGFDSKLQDFWEKDEVCHAEQTASRSTNTKLSTFYNNKGLMSMSQEVKPKHTFGTSHNFKSYKHL